MNDFLELDIRIREVIKRHGKLACDVSTLADTDDLYQAGLASHTSVEVMLALEGSFGVEFPNESLTRSAFSSIAAIRTVLRPLVAA